MKKILDIKFCLFLYLAFAGIQFTNAQVRIDGEREVELGISYTYTIETDINFHIVQWELPSTQESPAVGTITYNTPDANGLITSVNVVWNSNLENAEPWQKSLYLLIVNTDTNDPLAGPYDTTKYVRVKNTDPIVFPDPLDTNQNYVKTSNYRIARDPNSATSDYYKNQQITYFDELGRPLQQIAIGAGGNWEDIVTPIFYDGLGRQTKEYLPFAVSSNNNGSLITNPLESVHNFYNTEKYENTLNPYSEKVLENSALGRILEQAAPGEDWKVIEKIHPNEIIYDHTIKFEHGFNSQDDAVRWYNVQTAIVNDQITNSLVVSSNNSGIYNNNELYKTVTKDENWEFGKNHTTDEFKNKAGQVLLKRTYANIDLNSDGDTLDTDEAEVAHDTYYVYDDFGNLTFVIPPKVNTADGVSLNELDVLCYQYIYDGENRLIEKKIPGKAWEYIIYDNLDRPVLTQTGNQRSKTTPEWLFTKFDILGRVVYTGIYRTTDSRLQLQTLLDAKFGADTYEEKVTTGTGHDNSYYSNADFPNTNIELLTINYYDNYNFDLAEGQTSQTAFGVTSTDNTKGLATGSKVKVLGTSDWITTLSYYDEKARPIYTYNKNEYLNTYDHTKLKLNFLGQVNKSISIHKKANEEDIVVYDQFQYDRNQRLINQIQRIGKSESTIEAAYDIIEDAPTGATTLAANSITMLPGFIGLPGYDAKIDPTAEILEEELIVLNTYDELGQLESKKVGGDVLRSNPSNSSGLQTVNYKYNIRGWLKNINEDGLNDNDLFNFTLKYNNPTDGIPLYNGNISQTSWHTLNTDSSEKTYTYAYDNLNRIISAVDNTSKYNLNAISYDKNGNILTLNRQGHIVSNAIPDLSNASHFGTMDDLTYTYDNGNKLLSVSDAATTTGFKDGNNTTDDYDYDDDGNMIKDQNKGITVITYNHLNLPTQVTIDNGTNTGTISYIYDALGIKIEKKVTQTMSGSQSIKMTLYAGNYIYENDVLQFFSHPEGYISPELDSGSATSYNYVYQYKDHLGNVRLSYTDVNKDGIILTTTDPNTNELVEENNYYPFGLKHKGYNGDYNNSNANDVAQKFKYNGIEFEESLGLDLYEMPLRNYDPAIARWTGIDPVTHHSMSTYTAFDNNPVFWADPSGADSQHQPRNSMGFFEQNPFFNETNGLAGNADGGPGDPPTKKQYTYSGTKAGIGDNVTNLLDEVVISSSSSDSGGAFYSTETTDYAGGFEAWKKAHGYSGNYTEVLAQYNADWGSSFRPLTAAETWRINGTGFASAFDQGWIGWDPNGLGNDVMNIASASIGGAMALPAASLFAPSALGLGDKALNFAARAYLRYQISSGYVAGGSGTTILLGRYMDSVINPLARSSGYTTITNSLPAIRSLTMPYNRAWLQYHFNAGSTILMNVNSNSGLYSPYMQMEIKLLQQLYH